VDDHRERDRRIRDLHRVARDACDCRNCDLWRLGTQTVFGEGPVGAGLMLVGEQPGDREDIEGHPFVGPAGGVLDRALEAAGISREETYLTNAVKHFKWVEGRGDRRLHKKPNVAEMRACRPWLEQELILVRPRIVLCLGATAAYSLLGPKVSVTRERGRLFRPEFAPLALVTVHPSSVLRQRSDEVRRRAREEFEEDVMRAAHLLGETIQ
jgi:uracil-DNA glycosylase